MTDKTYSVTEAAEALKMSGKTLSEWIRIYEIAVKKNKQGAKLISTGQFELLKRIKKEVDCYPLVFHGKHTLIKQKLQAKNGVVQGNEQTETPVVVPNVEAKPVCAGSFTPIPDSIFDKIDFKALLSNEDIKGLLKRVYELEAAQVAGK
jgi:hypothetical protein